MSNITTSVHHSTHQWCDSFIFSHFKRNHFLFKEIKSKSHPVTEFSLKSRNSVCYVILLSYPDLVTLRLSERDKKEGESRRMRERRRGGTERERERILLAPNTMMKFKQININTIFKILKNKMRGYNTCSRHSSVGLYNVWILLCRHCKGFPWERRNFFF